MKGTEHTHDGDDECEPEGRAEVKGPHAIHGEEDKGSPHLPVQVGVAVQIPGERVGPAGPAGRWEGQSLRIPLWRAAGPQK